MAGKHQLAELRGNPGSGSPAQLRGQRFAGQAQPAAVTAVSPRDAALSLPGTFGSSFLLPTMRKVALDAPGKATASTSTRDCMRKNPPICSLTGTC
jgi:hypothetical protein